MSDDGTTKLTEADLDRALEFTRHYDNLLWVVTSLLLPANAGLLAFAAQNPSKQIGVLGVLLSVITVFFAASFRVLRLRLHARLSRDASRSDSWLYAGAAGWAGQWKIYVGLFAALSLLWVSLLWNQFPNWRVGWGVLLVAAFIAFGWLYLAARRHTPSSAD